MKEAIVQCSISNGIATICMDDGKSNLISPRMITQLNAALDLAERENVVVVLTGREGIFSAGFDLQILKSGVVNTFKMLVGGFRLSYRLLAFPTPVVIACPGHAIAMGSFLLLSGDYRVAAKGDFKIVANEVEIGLTMPYSAIEICRQRLVPAEFDRAVLLSQCYSPDNAKAAGFVDETVEASELMSSAMEVAARCAALNLNAHEKSKHRMRRVMLKNLKRAIRKDVLDFVRQGIRRVLRFG